MADSKIDTHAHFISPIYRKALVDNGHEKPDGIPYIPEWSVEIQLEFMNANGIAKSILSTSSPGTHLNPGEDKQASQLTRQVNEEAASLKRQYPSRFGFFATLPLPAIKESLEEIDFALDNLNADGFMLLSNHHGVYLGDPALDPVLKRLHARNAVVFVHPTIPCNRHHGIPQNSTQRVLNASPLSDGYMIPAFEFFFDSTRSFLDLFMSGAARKYPGIRWIVSHCGVALPSLLDRIVSFSNINLPEYTAREMIPITADEIKSTLQKQFWFDLAGNSMPNQIYDLLRWVGSDRLLYGSDMPWTPVPSASRMAAHMKEELPKLLGPEEVDAVYQGNAKKLFKRVLDND